MRAENEGDCSKTITVEFALALPARQWVFELSLPNGTTAGEAAAIGLAKIAAEIDAREDQAILGLLPADPWQAQSWPLGLFSKPCVPEQRLKSGDRVELYRPLQVDPMQSRRSRAKLELVKAKTRTKG
jgi:uncharacterized protein